VSDVRLAAMLSDEGLARELLFVRLAMQDDPHADQALEELFEALTGEAAKRWWRTHQPIRLRERPA